MPVRTILIFVIGLSSFSGAAEDARYDETTWLCTHNAMNASDDGWKLPNQTHTITKQLDQGVRALMLDVWKQNGQLVLRHGPPLARFLGYKKLSIELTNIRRFLIKNPESIVTLIFETHAPPAELAQAITGARLSRYCHRQDPAKPWPLLSDMRKSGKRLVVFSDRVGKESRVPAWFMPLWDHAWETNWQAKNKEELLAAKPRRGKRSNRLFILNHFITRGLPSINDAAQVNKNPFLKRRLDLAAKSFRRRPNFLVLDFYHTGDGMTAVKALNQRTETPGKKRGIKNSRK